MIARSWDGTTPAAQADEYADYVRRTGVTDLAATDGNRGVYLLRRREGDRARFRVLSLWDSMEGVRRFAGDDPEKARYYPDDSRFLLALEPRVEHFEVVAAEGGAAGGGAGGGPAGLGARSSTSPRRATSRSRPRRRHEPGPTRRSGCGWHTIGWSPEAPPRRAPAC